MKTLFEQIVDEFLIEQEQPEAEKNVQTEHSVYTPEQQKFLARFGELGATHLGILYSDTPEGRQEFINRSGMDFNCTPYVLTSLEQGGIISIIPYGGKSRDTDFTIQLNIDLDDVKGFTSGLEKGDKEDATGAAEPTDTSVGGGGGGFSAPPMDLGGEPPAEDLGGDVGGAPGGEGAPIEGGEEPVEGGDEGGEEPEPLDIPDEGPTESFRKDGDLLLEMAIPGVYSYRNILIESVRSTKRVVEQKNKRKASIYANASRVLKRLPTGYIHFLEKIIGILAKKTYNDLEREHLVADILDNLAYNFGLTPYQILKAYVYYKNQNRLKNVIKK
jgi:hypothetical protein